MTGNHNTQMCVVYCRVSSDKQAAPEKTSLDDQEQRGLTKARELGLQVLYVARHAESAWLLDKRSQFQGILADARASTFGVLIVDRMNRFSRSEDITEAFLVLKQLEDTGVQVEFCDRQYSRDVMGRMMQVFELGMSARDQEERRKASYGGLVGRAKKGHHPIPSRRALYGYVWKPTQEGGTKKTELLKDPGAAQAVVDRIWRYFLHYTPTTSHPRPTLRGIKTLLNQEHVPPPTAYQGIHYKNSKLRGIWTTATIHKMLHNGVYWGEPRPALSDSKFRGKQLPVPIPAYGPTYVTPAEAARVHAILAQNGRHGGRPPKRDRGTLLHGGLVYCAYCKGRLDCTIAALSKPIMVACVATASPSSPLPSTGRSSSRSRSTYNAGSFSRDSSPRGRPTRPQRTGRSVSPKPPTTTRTLKSRASSRLPRVMHRIRPRGLRSNCSLTS